MGLRLNQRAVVRAAAGCGLFGGMAFTPAATLTWNGGTGTWDQNPANTPWSGSPWADGNDAAFAAAAGNTNNSTVGAQTITVAAAVAPLSLTFNGGAGAFRFTASNGGVINDTGAGVTAYAHSKGAYADFGSAGLLNFTNAPGGSSVAGTGSAAILNGATLGGNDFVLAQAGTLVAPTYASATTALTASDNDLVGGSFTMSANTTVNGLKFDATTGRTLTLGSGTALTITSGMVLTQANTTQTITGNRTVTPTNGELELVANGNLVLNANVTSGNSITKSGAGTVFATGTSNTTTGTLRVLEGTYQFGNNGGGGEITGTGATVVIGNGARLNVRHATGDVTFDKNISGSGNFQLNYTGTAAATYTLSGANGNLLGGTTVNTAVGGNTTAFNVTLKAGSATAFGTGTLTITSNAATSAAVAAGTPGATLASTVDVGGFSMTTGLLSDGGYGAASALTNSGTAATLTLSGTGTQSYGGLVRDGAGTLALTKAGVGTQVLTNANAYSGLTTVSGGRLRLANGTGSATGTGPVNLSATLDGTGASGGALAVNGGTVAPGVNGAGNVGSPATLGLGTLGGITLTDAVVPFDLADTAGGASDLIATGGVFTPTGVAFQFNALAATLDTATPYALVSGFTNTPDLTGVSGTVLQGGYTPTFSTNGGTLFVSFSGVPEPGVLGLLGVGISGLLCRRRA